MSRSRVSHRYEHSLHPRNASSIASVSCGRLALTVAIATASTPLAAAVAHFSEMSANASAAVASWRRSGRVCPGCIWNMTVSSPALRSLSATSAFQRIPFVSIAGLRPRSRMSRTTSAICGWSKGSPPVMPTLFTFLSRWIAASSSRIVPRGLCEGGRRLKHALQMQLHPRTTSSSAAGTSFPFHGSLSAFIFFSPVPSCTLRTQDAGIRPRRQGRSRTDLCGRQACSRDPADCR